MPNAPALPDLDAARTRSGAMALPTPTEAALALAEGGPIRRRAVSPLGALRNLGLHKKVRLRALTVADVRVEADASRVPACEACPDTCCRGPGTGISLRLADIARLVDAGLHDGIAPLQRWTAADYAGDPGLAEVEERESHRRFPMLRRRDDGSCVFLDDESRCAIHHIRPLACRAFPYRLDDDRTRVHFSARCPSFTDGGDERQVEDMVSAVLGLYNAKVKDLVVLTHGRRELSELGLSRFLPVVE